MTNDGVKFFLYEEGLFCAVVNECSGGLLVDQLCCRAATLHPPSPPFCLSPPPSLSRTLLEQVDHWQSFLALVNMIMFCTGIPGHYPVNETISSLTLTFWYTLQVRERIHAFNWKRTLSFVLFCVLLRTQVFAA